MPNPERRTFLVVLLIVLGGLAWSWTLRADPELYRPGHGVQCPALAPGGWQCALVEGHEAIHHEQVIHWSDEGTDD